MQGARVVEVVLLDGKVYDNGLTLVVDRRPGMRFVTVGYMVGTGAYGDPAEQRGIAHLTEHLVFKGTAQRSAAQINREIDELGGDINAYTCESRTVFIVTVLREYLSRAIDVLNDIVFCNTVPVEEFDREKNVVLDELAMYADRGENRVRVLALRTALPDNPSRWDIGGSVETVSNVTRDDVLAFIDANYVPSNVTVVVTGDVALDDVDQIVSGQLVDFTGQHAPFTPAPLGQLHLEDSVEQMNIGHSHLAFWWFWPRFAERREIATAVLACNALGNGLGSRFARIREEYGYCYTIGCLASHWEDAFGVCGYAGTDLQNIEHVKQLIGEILDKVCAEGLDEWEYTKAVNTCVCEVLRRNETSEDANEWAISYIDNEWPLDVDEACDTFRSITIDEVNKFIADNLTSDTVHFAEVHQRDEEDEQ